MAGPAQLITMVSRATGLALPTVTDIDRRLVKAGLRSKTGRGPNAARMTALDVARLLTAMLGSPQANGAAETVERYADTKVDRARSSEALFGAAELADLATLPRRHSFVDGLTALIASAASGSLAELTEGLPAGQHPRIEVLAMTRATHGRIRISGLPNGLAASLEYAPRGPRGVMRAGAGHGTGDLEQSRRITERTIYAVATILKPEGQAA